MITNDRWGTAAQIICRQITWELPTGPAQSVSSNYILQSVGMSAHDLSPTCWITVPWRPAASVTSKCYVKTVLPFWGSLLIRKKKKKKRVQTLQSDVVEIFPGLCFSFKTFFSQRGKQKHGSLKWPRRSVYCFQACFYFNLPEAQCSDAESRVKAAAEAKLIPPKLDTVWLFVTDTFWVSGSVKWSNRAITVAWLTCAC